MRHTISVRVENKFGVLTRITSLFSGRGFNIDTLNVAPTENPSVSKMTLVVVGDDKVVDQVTKLLNKLVNVIEVHDFKEGEYVDRELALIKIKADAKVRPEVMQFCEIFRAKIVNVQPKDLTIEITGDEQKITKFLELMANFGVLELTRTGKVVLPRE
ncbi:MAG: acetolactate synthase small subunit [Verrucomicrobiales bacterium]|jgi:acetolactate synthase-1/3 small subunit|nr:acetolactate synthase small subunit [Verrucomicrobiales bacterium]